MSFYNDYEDYDPYWEPEYTQADAEYDAWMDEQMEARDIELGVYDSNAPVSEEDRDESDLSDAQLDALDALNMRDEIDPPQPPAELLWAWAAIDAA